MPKITVESLNAHKEAHEQRINDLERTVETIKNRVHPWLVAIMTTGGTLIGGLISHIIGR